MENLDKAILEQIQAIYKHIETLNTKLEKELEKEVEFLKKQVKDLRAVHFK